MCKQTDKETDKKYDSKLENPVTESTASRHNLAAGVSWPPSSYFGISINLKTCMILEWSIMIRFVISTTFKPCAITHLSV